MQDFGDKQAAGLSYGSYRNQISRIYSGVDLIINKRNGSG
jgi:hypothetical protein